MIRIPGSQTDERPRRVVGAVMATAKQTHPDAVEQVIRSGRVERGGPAQPTIPVFEIRAGERMSQEVCKVGRCGVLCDQLYKQPSGEIGPTDVHQRDGQIPPGRQQVRPRCGELNINPDRLAKLARAMVVERLSEQIVCR